MPPTLRLTLLTLVSLLLAAAPAMASAGGGSSGFGGGGGGGGFSGGSSSSSSGSGHVTGGGLVFLVIVVLLVVFGGKMLTARARAKRRAQRDARRREVELAAAEAAQDDASFDAAAVRDEARKLFMAVQKAWDARDRDALARMVAPEMMVEWKRRLDDFDRKGWHNRVEVLGAASVDYVGLVNKEGVAEDRVTVFVNATLRDFVVDKQGRHIKKSDSASETTTCSEYWTLGRRDGRWVLLSIEQELEGAHHLSDKLVASTDHDDSLRDEARLEIAQDEKLPEGFALAEVADLDFDGDARAAALDLSLADGRFAPDVLEIAARRAVAGWAEAVDGEDTALLSVATQEAAHQLLYPRGESSRLVVRGPGIRNLRIVALDAAATPATMTLQMEVSGRRYVEDRDTAAVLEGSRERTATFTERWTLALAGDDANPWRIVDARAHAPAR